MFSLSFTLAPAVVPDDPEKKPVEEAEDEQGKKKENVGVGIDHSDTVDFIRSNNHTIAQAHDISCVCMHPPALPVLHLTGRMAGCAIVAGTKESGNSRKVPDFKGFSACMLFYVIVSNRSTILLQTEKCFCNAHP